MRPRSALLFGLVVLVPAMAWADILGPNEKRVQYLFALSNTAAFPDWRVVAFPYSASLGAPTVDYVVMDSPRRERLGRWAVPHFYGVRASRLGIGPPTPSTARDGILGVLESPDRDITAPVRIAELDRLEPGALRQFFDTDPRLVRSTPDVRPAGIETVPSGSEVRRVVDVFAIRRADDGGFRVALERTVYQYEDLTEDSVSAASDGRRRAAPRDPRVGGAPPDSLTAAPRAAGGCSCSAAPGPPRSLSSSR